MVVAQLVSVQPAQFGCGVIHVGSAAIYKVLDGPAALRGMEITVLVGCIEMPRSIYKRYAGEGGDLEAFTPGEIHRLNISKTNTHGIELPALPPGEHSFYLRAAYANALRPDTGR